MPACRIAALGIAAILAGCTTVHRGDLSAAGKLKEFEPVAGRLSVYVCRIPAFTAGGVTSTILINGHEIGALRPNSFVHAALAPGKHVIELRNDGVWPNPRQLEVEGNANELKFVWVGITGFGMGVYTIDHFTSVKQGMNCVQNAVYTVAPGAKSAP